MHVRGEAFVVDASDDVGIAPRTAERIARNDATFRAANEGIERAARALEFEGELVPFICECAAEDCAEIVRLSLHEYEEIRARPRRFLNTLGHHVDEGDADVVSENDRYMIVEKTGRAGDVAEDLDPRS